MDRLGTDKDTPLPAVDRLKPDVVLLELLDTASLRTIQRVTTSDRLVLS